MAFLRLHNEGQAAYRALFTTPPSLLRPVGAAVTVPLTLATKRPAGPGRTVLDDYQTNSGLSLASSGATVALTPSLVSASERSLEDLDPALDTEPANRFFQATAGALFQWTAAGQYTDQKDRVSTA